LSERERNTHLTNLGKAIRAARGSLTQAQLGALLQVPQTTISRWEKGQVALDVIQVAELEQALGLEGGSLLIAAGLIPGRRTVKDVAKALLTEPNIDPALRRDLVAIYKNYVRLSKPARR
jgi:transcriptional regulator with XRE-family HTH domain